MAIKLEIVVGYVGDGVGGAAGATAVVEQFNSDKQGFALVNQHAQTGAAVANVLSIVSVMGGFIPFLNIATNTFAGTTTFLKLQQSIKIPVNSALGTSLASLGTLREPLLLSPSWQDLVRLVWASLLWQSVHRHLGW